MNSKTFRRITEWSGTTVEAGDSATVNVDGGDPWESSGSPRIAT